MIYRKILDKFLGLFLFLWFFITAGTGIILYRGLFQEGGEWHVSPAFHSEWSVMTVILVFLCEYRWVKRLRDRAQEAVVQDFVLWRYVLMLWLFVSVITGMASYMGFLPVVFHQILVWPLIPVFLWDIKKIFFKKIFLG